MIEVRPEGRIYESCLDRFSNWEICKISLDIPKLGKMAHLSVDEEGYYNEA